MTLSCGKLVGNFTREIAITTNDPQHPRETLTCKGQILEALTMEPKYLHFGQVPAGISSERKVSITRGDGGPLRLKLSPAASPGVTAKINEIKRGERYELVVTLKPPAEPQQISATLELQTGVAEAPKVTLPVYAMVAPPNPPREPVGATRAPQTPRGAR